jgi:hypothetical protein
MTLLDSKFVTTIVEEHKENLLFGRWITACDIEKVFSSLQNSSKLLISNIGI